MAMNLKTLIVILLVSFSIQLTDADWIDCGKKNPTKEEDCTKYGTDSGFLCCYILNDNRKECKLMSYGEAKDKDINDRKNLTNDEGLDTLYSCGNNSSYLKYTFAAISFALFGILLL